MTCWLFQDLYHREEKWVWLITISGAVEQSLIDKLNDVREGGNASAHSIEIQVGEEDLEKFREKVNHLSKNPI